MSVSDAILIGEDWISEHYFTTDATSQSFHAQVLGRRKIWDDQKDTGSVRTRFTAARGSTLARLAALDDDPDGAESIRKDLIEILGFATLGLTHTSNGPLTQVRQFTMPDVAGVALVAATPVETVEDLLEKDADTLAEPYDLDDTTQLTSVPRLLSALFVAEDAPAFALVLAGRIALIAERERWPEGRYLAIDLQLVCERNDDKKGGEVDTALACLSAESLAPDAEGNIWWHAVLDESIKHTVGVSQDLREGVRLSIEIIANDVVNRRVQQEPRSAATRGGSTAREASPEVPLPHPVPPLRRSLTRARRPPDRCHRVRPGLQPRPAPGAHSGPAHHTSVREWDPSLRLLGCAVQARRPGLRPSDQRGRRRAPRVARVSVSACRPVPR